MKLIKAPEGTEGKCAAQFFGSTSTTLRHVKNQHPAAVSGDDSQPKIESLGRFHPLFITIVALSHFIEAPASPESELLHQT